MLNFFLDCVQKEYPLKSQQQFLEEKVQILLDQSWNFF